VLDQSPSPKGHVDGRTTRGYLDVQQALSNPITVGSAPRPIPQGTAAGGAKAALKISAKPSKAAADGKKRAYTAKVSFR
jgi:hypothetical protein